MTYLYLALSAAALIGVYVLGRRHGRGDRDIAWGQGYAAAESDYADAPIPYRLAVPDTLRAPPPVATVHRGRR